MNTATRNQYIKSTLNGLCLATLVGFGYHGYQRAQINAERIQINKFHNNVVAMWYVVSESNEQDSLQDMIWFCDIIQGMDASHLNSDYREAFRAVQTASRDVMTECKAVPAKDDTLGQVMYGINAVGNVVRDLPSAPADDAGMVENAGYVLNMVDGVLRGREKLGAPMRNAVTRLDQSMQTLNGVARL